MLSGDSNKLLETMLPNMALLRHMKCLQHTHRMLHHRVLLEWRAVRAAEVTIQPTHCIDKLVITGCMYMRLTYERMFLSRRSSRMIGETQERHA